eukprot:ctg_609.g276
MSLNQSCAIWVQVADTGHPLTARFGHAATVFFNGTTDLVFVYGGRNAQADALGDLFMCDPTVNACHQRLADGDVPTPRSAAGAAQVGHRLVLFGGLLQTSASSSAAAATDSNNANSNAFSLLDVLREPANWADRQQVLQRAPVYRQRALWEAGWGRGVIPVSGQATTVTESGRDILFFGGDIGGGRFSRCVFQYEFELSTWSLAFQPPNNARCTDEAAAGVGPSADPGGRASASAVPYGAHDALLFGGSRYTGNTATNARIHVFDDLWLFRSDTSSWQLLGNGSSSRASSAWPSPRDGHAMSVAPAWMASEPAYLLYGGRGCPGARTSCSPRDVRLLGDAWLLSCTAHADGARLPHAVHREQRGGDAGGRPQRGRGVGRCVVLAVADAAAGRTGTAGAARAHRGRAHRAAVPGAVSAGAVVVRARAVYHQDRWCVAGGAAAAARSGVHRVPTDLFMASGVGREERSRPTGARHAGAIRRVARCGVRGGDAASAAGGRCRRGAVGGRRHARAAVATGRRLAGIHTTGGVVRRRRCRRRHCAQSGPVGAGDITQHGRRAGHRLAFVSGVSTAHAPRPPQGVALGGVGRVVGPVLLPASAAQRGRVGAARAHAAGERPVGVVNV